MAPIYYCFDNKLRFSKQVVLSLRLYDKEIITLVSLGIGSIMILPIPKDTLVIISIYYNFVCAIIKKIPQCILVQICVYFSVQKQENYTEFRCFQIFPQPLVCSVYCVYFAQVNMTIGVFSVTLTLGTIISIFTCFAYYIRRFAWIVLTAMSYSWTF